MAYLVRSHKSVKIVALDQCANNIVVQFYAVIGIRQPDHVPGQDNWVRVFLVLMQNSLMTLNVLPAKEVKIFGDCAVIGIALLDVHVPCS
jgi:hypothetical protein